jgi:hypothetical protein
MRESQSVLLAAREDGRVDRPVQTAAIWSPKVLRLEVDFVVCSANESQTKNHGTGLLDEFIALADSDADDWFRFGKKWGALSIAPTARPGLEFAEPVQAWRQAARRVRALYRIGAELSAARTGNSEDWTVLGTQVGKSIREARFGVMSQMRKLVTDAHLQPRFHWNPNVGGLQSPKSKPAGSAAGQWQIDLDAAHGRSNLLAVLTIQLMIRIADKDGFAICSICHKSYVPKRMPTATKRNYCDDPRCRRQVWKHLKRQQRKRKRYGKT